MGVFRDENRTSTRTMGVSRDENRKRNQMTRIFEVISPIVFDTTIND